MNRTLSLLPLILLTACPGYKPEPEITCDATKTVLDPSETSSLGFSADELFTSIGLDFAETLEYSASAEKTPLTLSLTLGEVRDIDEEAFTHFYDGTTEPADQACDDRMEIDATLGFVTEDGVFDESLPVTVVARDDASAHISFLLDPSALHGTFDPLEHVPEGTYESLETDLSVELSAEGSLGSVQIHGEKVSDECDGCTDQVTEDFARWSYE